MWKHLDKNFTEYEWNRSSGSLWKTETYRFRVKRQCLGNLGPAFFRKMEEENGRGADKGKRPV